ncbi:Co-chaperone protein DjlA [subsurface metagenome]
MNLRVCYQVIDNIFRWDARGVSGLVQGKPFMGGDLVATGPSKTESFDEACAILGVDPEASWEEIQGVYRIKVNYAHPDKFEKPEEKKVAEERFKRIQRAYELVKKVKEPR